MDLSSSRNILTQEGYDKIKQELEEILKVKRPAVVQRIEEARALGDLSENFDYQDAKRQQGMIEARLEQLKTILNTATVADCSENNGCVTIGSKVMIRDCDDGFEEEYTIVGSAEADPSDGKISYESSMGAALVGHKAGDSVLVETPAGQFSYEIVSVS